MSCAGLGFSSDKVLVNAGFAWAGRYHSQVLVTFKSFQNFYIVFHCLFFFVEVSIFVSMAFCYSSDSFWKTLLSFWNPVVNSKDATWVFCL